VQTIATVLLFAGSIARMRSGASSSSIPSMVRGTTWQVRGKATGSSSWARKMVTQYDGALMKSGPTASLGAARNATPMDSGGSLPNSNCGGLLESSGDFWRITSNSEVIRARSRLGGSAGGKSAALVRISAKPVSGQLPVGRQTSYNASAPGARIFKGSVSATTARSPRKACREINNPKGSKLPRLPCRSDRRCRRRSCSHRQSHLWRGLTSQGKRPCRC